MNVSRAFTFLRKKRKEKKGYFCSSIKEINLKHLQQAEEKKKEAMETVVEKLLIESSDTDVTYVLPILLH